MSQPPPCPYCGATSYRLRDPRWLVCRECENEFDLQHDLCRACGRLNPVGENACVGCGTPLSRDTVDQLITERGRNERAWREYTRTIGAGQKGAEEQASQQRMANYWAEDRTRREAVAQRLAEQRARDKRILIIVLVSSAILILVAAIIILFSLNGDLVSVLQQTAPRGTPLVQRCLAGMHQTGPG